MVLTPADPSSSACPAKAEFTANIASSLGPTASALSASADSGSVLERPCTYWMAVCNSCAYGDAWRAWQCGDPQRFIRHVAPCYRILAGRRKSPRTAEHCSRSRTRATGSAKKVHFTFAVTPSRKTLAHMIAGGQARTTTNLPFWQIPKWSNHATPHSPHRTNACMHEVRLMGTSTHARYVSS